MKSSRHPVATWPAVNDWANVASARSRFSQLSGAVTPPLAVLRGHTCCRRAARGPETGHFRYSVGETVASRCTSDGRVGGAGRVREGAGGEGSVRWACLENVLISGVRGGALNVARRTYRGGVSLTPRSLLITPESVESSSDSPAELCNGSRSKRQTRVAHGHVNYLLRTKGWICCGSGNVNCMCITTVCGGTERHFWKRCPASDLCKIFNSRPTYTYLRHK